jgi:hypothetical protein
MSDTGKMPTLADQYPPRRWPLTGAAVTTQHLPCRPSAALRAPPANGGFVEWLSLLRLANRKQ